MQGTQVCGALVRRKTDPVHTGRVTLHTRTQATVTVIWLGARPIKEYRVPLAELEAGEDWK